MRYKEPASSCDDGAKTSENVVVPVGHFENGESPDAPARMAFRCALGQVLVEQGVRAESHDDKQVGYGLLSEGDAFEHGRRLRITADTSAGDRPTTQTLHGNGDRRAPPQAVEQSRQGLAIKGTKNRQRRVTTFPASLVEPLEGSAHRAEIERGREGLLFRGLDGGFNRRWFQRVWARAAREAGWPMKRPTAAVWHPHDLRHVAACWLLFGVGLDPVVVATLRWTLSVLHVTTTRYPDP